MGNTETGHEGNGYARITLLNNSQETELLTKAFDLSGNGYHGEFIGGVKIQKDDEGNQGIYFDGSESYVDLGILPDTINWADGFSYEFEAKWLAFNSYSRIFDFGNGASKDNIFFTNNSTTNKLYSGVFYGSTVYQTPSGGITDISLNQRIKVKIVYEKTSTGFKEIIYKNDILVNSREYQTQNFVANVNRTTNYLGKSNFPGDLYFKGYIYNIKFIDANDNIILWYKFDNK